VAVATGAAAVALGSDTGGSIRQPAAYCGVAGLKPSYGRISRHGLIAYASSLDTVGVFARGVGDSALALDIVSGEDGSDDRAVRQGRSDLGRLLHHVRSLSGGDTSGAALGAQKILAIRTLLGGGATATSAVTPLLFGFSSVTEAAPSGTVQSSADGGYLAIRASTAFRRGLERLVAAATEPEVAALRKEFENAAHATNASGGGSSSVARPLAGLRVGLPAEYAVAELADSVREAWERGAAALAKAGAEVVTVSLPTTRAALAAYYLIAPAEAASNLSRYDGLRYGYRADEADAAALSASAAAEFSGLGDDDGSPAAALHALYTQTRSAGFGREVRRRILVGNYVMSRAARAEFLDAAVRVRAQVAADFACVFRSRQAAAGSPAAADAAWDAAEMDAVNVRSRLYLGSDATFPCPAAEAARGVDVLLTPTAPGLPWASKDTETTDPTALYSTDVMTIPVSLAGLPAISVPFGSTRVSTATSSSLRLPMGLQLVGRYLDESTVLRTAQALESAAPGMQ
jgi:Asp-tRNA(Asn)/Glu-tRNA(Gln) amidotransferase A subunit family amidase